MIKKQLKDQPDEKIRFRDLIAKEESSEKERPSNDKVAEPEEVVDHSREASQEKVSFTELREVDQKVNPDLFAPEKEPKPSHEDGTNSEEESTKALYNQIYKATSLVYENAANGNKIDIDPLIPLATALAEAVTQPEPEEEITCETLPKPTFYWEIMVAITASLDWPAHGIHVAALATKLGAGAGYNKEGLTNLALAGLVHDVGMMRMPLAILERPGRISSEERAIIQTHPIQAAEILGDVASGYEWLQTSVLQEHERYRGQGYPYGISGRDIDEYARIIGMVDAFVAMTQPRPWRPPMTPHEAAKELIYVRKDEFDPRFIKLFLKRVSIFPIKSLVRLSNNEVGQILAVHEDSPLRPTIEILQFKRGKQMVPHKILDLRKRPLLYITGSVAEKELAEL